MYHFISGYTAKIPGAEDGVPEPETTFLPCFGAPFMPLHPTKYAEMLGEKMENTRLIFGYSIQVGLAENMAKASV